MADDNGGKPKVTVNPGFRALMEPFEAMTHDEREAAAVALLSQLVGTVMQALSQGHVVIPDLRRPL